MFIQHGFKLNMVKLSSYCIYNYDNLLSNLSVIQVCLDWTVNIIKFQWASHAFNNFVMQASFMSWVVNVSF